MLKEIIKNTLMLLGREDELLEVEQKAPSEFAPTTTKIVNSLIKITSLVLSDITREVAKLNGEVELESDENCQIMYKDFGRKVIGVKNVRHGICPVTFNLYPEYVKVGKPNVKYTIEFCYENEKCTSLDDEIILPISVTPAAVSYGVASEYASIHLLYDECNMWEQKYTRALENIRDKCGERKVFRWWK